MDWELVPSDILKCIFAYSGSKCRAKICSVNVKWYGLALEFLNNHENIEDIWKTIEKGDYHLFVRLFTRKHLTHIVGLLGCAARSGSSELLQLFIDEKHIVMAYDFSTAGSGGSFCCIEMLINYASSLGIFIRYTDIVKSAAIAGYIDIVREYIHKCGDNQKMHILVEVCKEKTDRTEIIKLILSKLRFVDHFEYALAARRTIISGSIENLRTIISLGFVLNLEDAGEAGNILAFEELVKCGLSNYNDAFITACEYHQMEFAFYMLEHYLIHLNLTEGFTSLGIKMRIPFMQKCIELKIKIDVNRWLEDTFRTYQHQAQDVCKWILSQPTLELSEELRGRYMAVYNL